MKKILPFIVAILLSTTVFGQHNGFLPVDGLLAWYPFCNINSATISDHSPTDPLGFNSLTNSGVAFATDRFTNANNAGGFSGAASAYISTPFLYTAGFTTSDFTYSCWIYPLLAQYSVIWYNGNPTDDGYGIFMNNGALLPLGAAGVDVDVVFGGGIGLFATTVVSLNAWHHLVLTKNGGGYIFYVDGIGSSFIPATGFTLPINTDQFTVGENYTGTPTTAAFNGSIDDLGIYSVYLAPGQIDSLNTYDPDVAPFTFGNLGSDTTICSPSITLTSTEPYDTSFSYAWSTGSTDTSITVIPPVAPGTDYSLRITALYGCFDIANFDISHLNVGVHIGPRDTTFCVSGSAILNPTPDSGETYIWSTGATTGSILISDSGAYSVIVDSAGCTGYDTTTVTVQAPVIVNLGVDTSSCNGQPIVLKSSIPYTTVTGIVSYHWGWDSTGTIGGILTNPTYTVTASSTYWLVVDSAACIGSDTVHVGVLYDTMTILTPDTSVCKPPNGTASVQVRGYGNPDATYLWTPTAGLSSAGGVNPFITPDTSATYVVTATLGTCVISDTLRIDVQPQPTVYIGGNKNICKGDTIHITAFVTPSWYTHYIYYWSPGTNLDNSATTVGDSAISTVVFTAGDSTDLVLLVRTPLDSTEGKCRAIDSAEIMVHTPKETVLRDTSICPGDSLILNPNFIAGDTYGWHSGMYLNDSNAVQPVAKPITTISYWTKSTDQFGCFDTATENVIVYPGAVIDLGDSVILYPGETYQISPQTNCVFFSWKPPLGLSDTSASNPIAAPAVNTKYIVTATTEWGCSVKDSLDIDIDETSIVAIPNAFTPDAGVNTILYILKRGVVSLNYFHIFNRWGNKVYESTNIDAGWDGTYKGKPQPFDVYVYDLQAVTNDGVIFQKTGNITLIR